MSSKVLYAIYEEGDDLLHAVETVREKGMDVVDCYTPYPVHGLDNVMGIKRSRLPIAAFCFAMLGLASAIVLQYFTMGYDWPMIIGGKPYVGLPSWIPVCFELSILFTAYGMGITFFVKSRMLHGMEADIKDIRQTDNRLVMAIDVSSTDDTTGLENLLKDTKASEIKKPYLSANEVTSQSVVEKSKPEPVEQESPKAKSNVATKKAPELSEEEKGKKIDIVLGKIGKASGSAKDDLKKVKGIGPVFEKNLNSIGISTFEQISKMDSETIKLIEEVTRYFPGKIERENWIEQALELMKK